MKKFLSLLRVLLIPFSGIYYILYLIDKTYKSASRKIIKDSFILSIGNITTGGTGKTPFAIFLALALKKYSPIIITRGYRSGLQGKVISSKKLSLRQDLRDEPGLLASRSGSPVSINSNRYQAIQQARRVLPGNKTKAFYLMDDGFQHYKLARDMDIVLIDCTNPFGNGLLIPAGNLREPLSAVKRADRIILTRSESVTDIEKKMVLARLKKIGVSPEKIFMAYTKIEGVFDHLGKKISFSTMTRLVKGKIFAFAGVGNFQNFIRTTDALFPKNGLIKFHKYTDHCEYGESELSILKAALKEGYQLVTTEKDINKLSGTNFPCFSIRISIKIENEKEFIQGIERALRE